MQTGNGAGVWIQQDFSWIEAEAFGCVMWSVNPVSVHQSFARTFQKYVPDIACAIVFRIQLDFPYRIAIFLGGEKYKFDGICESAVESEIYTSITNSGAKIKGAAGFNVEVRGIYPVSLVFIYKT